MYLKSLLFTLLFFSFSQSVWATPEPPPMVCSIQELSLLEGFRTSPTTVRFPFRLVGRLIIVKAAVNGQKGYFVVDTGAEKLVLNAKHYQGVSYKANLVAVSATGEVGEVRKTKLDSLNWDNLIFEDFLADVVDLSHIEKNKNIQILGLLGYEVLKDYEVLLDYQKKQMVLSQTDSDGERFDKEAYFEEAVDSLGFDLHNGIILLEGKLGKEKMTFALDSGAELNLLDRNVKKKVLKKFKIIKRVKLFGVEDQQIEVLAGEMKGIELEHIQCKTMRTLLTNLSDLNRVYGFHVKGLIGYEFLGNRRTIINYKKQKLYFLAWERA